MNWGSWLLWGFVATVVLTIIMAASQGLRITRMNIPYMLGALFTPNRDRAAIIGFAVHIVDGLIFSLLYVAALEAWDRTGWAWGALIGFVHGAFVLTVGVPILPGLHSRIAGERHGPAVTPQLEPPGFLALNYGVRTPISVLLAHLAYGAIFGAFYRLG